MQLYSKHTTWTVAVAIVGTVLVGSSLLAAAQKSTKEGVFSAAQAKRGEALYKEQCASCHSADLSGGGAPQLAGADFLGFWDKTPVSDLVVKIKDTMPASSPGSLNKAQAVDIATFILISNKFPPGSADLSQDDAALKTVMIAK